MKLKVGHTMQAQIDRQSLYFFDTNSGLRL